MTTDSIATPNARQGFSLRPYQVDALNKTLTAFGTFRKVLGVAPTGSGKTRIFSALTRERMRHGQVMIIAHREELIQQAIDKLYRDERIMADKEKAEFRARPNAQVIVASVQSLRGDRRKRFNPATITVDEAHHVLADSYQTVLAEWPNAKVFGCTATPDRGDKKNLAKYFDEIAFEIPMQYLQQEGFLSKIVCQTVPIDIDISNVRRTAGDFNADDLGDAIEPVLKQVVEAIIEHASDRKTLVFLPLIKTAQIFAGLAQQAGINAEWVSGDDPDRAEKLKRFSRGEIQLLANSMLLTEGYDEPSIDCVVCLRPTQSRALYCQIVGRGTRPSPGKENLLILDFLWHVERHSLVKAAHLIASSEDEAEKMAKLIEKASKQGPLDLDVVKHEAGIEREAEIRAAHERELALKRALERQKDKKKARIDPVEFALNLHAQAIMDFEPVMPWHSEPVSDKQRAALDNLGFDTGEVTCRGHASVILDTFFSRRQLNLATPKQIHWLIKKGHPSPHTATFTEATNFLNIAFRRR